MKKVADYVNRKQKEAENLNQIGIIERFIKIAPSLSTPSRKFRKCGILSLNEGKKARIVYCFLFSDALVTCKMRAKTGKNSLSRNSPVDSGDLKSQLDNLDCTLTFHMMYSLNGASLHDISNEESRNMFELSTFRYHLAFTAMSQEDYTSWMLEIDQIVNSNLERNFAIYHLDVVPREKVSALEEVKKCVTMENAPYISPPSHLPLVAPLSVHQSPLAPLPTIEDERQKIIKKTIPAFANRQNTLPVCPHLYETPETLGEGFEGLPEDIQHEIFAFCDLASLYSCHFVCQSWKEKLSPSHLVWRLMAASLFHLSIGHSMIQKRNLGSMNWRTLVVKTCTDQDFWSSQFSPDYLKEIDEVRLELQEAKRCRSPEGKMDFQVFYLSNMFLFFLSNSLFFNRLLLICI